MAAESGMAGMAPLAVVVRPPAALATRVADTHSSRVSASSAVPAPAWESAQAGAPKGVSCPCGIHGVYGKGGQSPLPDGVRKYAPSLPRVIKTADGPIA